MSGVFLYSFNFLIIVSNAVITAERVCFDFMFEAVDFSDSNCLVTMLMFVSGGIRTDTSSVCLPLIWERVSTISSSSALCSWDISVILVFSKVVAANTKFIG